MGTSSTGRAEALEAYGSRFDPGVPSRPRIAITGGRDHEPAWDELMAFQCLWRREGGQVLIHGAARGVDTIISERAKARGIEVIPVPVDHALDGPWPGAGPRRNWRMLTTKDPDLLVGFRGRRGTSGCIAMGRRLGLPVLRWNKEAGDFLPVED